MLPAALVVVRPLSVALIAGFRAQLVVDFSLQVSVLIVGVDQQALAQFVLPRFSLVQLELLTIVVLFCLVLR